MIHQKAKGQTVAIEIPLEAYIAIAELCIDTLDLDDVPDAQDLGSVAAHLLLLGLRAFEAGEATDAPDRSLAS